MRRTTVSNSHIANLCYCAVMNKRRLIMHNSASQSFPDVFYKFGNWRILKKIYTDLFKTSCKPAWSRTIKCHHNKTGATHTFKWNHKQLQHVVIKLMLALHPRNRQINKTWKDPNVPWWSCKKLQTCQHFLDSAEEWHCHQRSMLNHYEMIHLCSAQPQHL